MFIILALSLISVSCFSFNTDDGDLYEPDTKVTILRISVSSPPQKTVYSVGEIFDTSGMSVTAHYSNGTKRKVEDYNYSPAGALSARDSEITVSYRDKYIKQKITLTLGFSYSGFIDDSYDFGSSKKAVYEAEKAVVPGRILTGDRKNYPDTTKLNGASGGAWLGNTGFPDNWIEFYITSDKENDAVFQLVLACSFFWFFEPVYGGNIPMEDLSRFIDMTIFGCPVDLSGVRLKPGHYDTDDSLNTAWTNWTSLIIEGVRLAEGENILRIEVKPLYDGNGAVLKDPIWNSPVHRCPSLDVLNVWTA